MDRSKHLRWLAALSLLLTSNMAGAAWTLNMPKGATDISHQVHELHMIIFGVCVVIGIIVFGIMFVSMLMHRKSLGHEPASFHENTRLEIIWTIIPILILVAMAWPATTTLRAMYDSSEPDMDVQIKGYQWKWQYTYPNADPAKQVQFMSTIRTPQEEINNEAPKGEYYLHEVDNPLVIPVHERVRFLITSNDVIHSWFVPDFAIKKDAIPGFVNEAWTVVDEPGIYRGQCAELCGKDHAFMPIVVRAVPQDEFKKWLADKQAEAQQTYETVGKTWTMDELMEQGQQVYSQICSTCHQANGQGVPPAFPPLAGSQVVNGPIEAHADVVLHGRPGTAMQAFAEQLNPAEIAGVITYERNSFGNNQGDMIQPKEIDQMLSGTSEE